MKKYLLLIVIISFLASCKDKKPLVIEQIKQVSKLATVEYEFSKYIIADSEVKILPKVTVNKGSLFIESEAYLKLGVDLNKIKEKNITLSENKVHILLPAIEVINFSFPYEKIKILEDYSTISLRSFGIDKYNDFMCTAENRIRQDINYLNLVETAENKTTEFLTHLLKQAGYEEVDIEFEKSNKPLLYVSH